MDEYIKALREAARTRHAAILAAYDQTSGGNPMATLCDCVCRLGTWSSTRAAVVELVNAVHPDDGRISSASRRWAASFSGACRRERLASFGIYSGDIHAAHVEQLAEEFRRWDRNHGAECNEADRQALFGLEPGFLAAEEVKHNA